MNSNIDEIIKTTNKTKSPKPRIPLPTRKRKLAENILQGKNIKQSAIEAGYTPMTAHGKTTQLRKTAEQELAKMSEEMALNPHFSIPTLIKEYRWITEQRKDISTKHKAIAPILRQYDIIPKDEQDNRQTLPTLNIIVKELHYKEADNRQTTKGMRAYDIEDKDSG